jgi:hypothetical protein
VKIPNKSNIQKHRTAFFTSNPQKTTKIAILSRKMKRKNVKIKENSQLARLAALKLKSQKVAMVWGSTIHLYNATKDQFVNNQTWLLHELKHVEQFERLGFVRFMCTYVWESLRHGYHKNKLEAEARDAENDKTLLSRYHII